MFLKLALITNHMAQVAILPVEPKFVYVNMDLVREIRVSSYRPVTGNTVQPPLENTTLYYSDEDHTTVQETPEEIFAAYTNAPSQRIFP